MYIVIQTFWRQDKKVINSTKEWEPYIKASFSNLRISEIRYMPFATVIQKCIWTSCQDTYENCRQWLIKFSFFLKQNALRFKEVREAGGFSFQGFHIVAWMLHRCCMLARSWAGDSQYKLISPAATPWPWMSFPYTFSQVGHVSKKWSDPHETQEFSWEVVLVFSHLTSLRHILQGTPVDPLP